MAADAAAETIPEASYFPGASETPFGPSTVRFSREQTSSILFNPASEIRWPRPSSSSRMRRRFIGPFSFLRTSSTHSTEPGGIRSREVAVSSGIFSSVSSIARRIEKG